MNDWLIWHHGMVEGSNWKLDCVKEQNVSLRALVLHLKWEPARQSILDAGVIQSDLHSSQEGRLREHTLLVHHAYLSLRCYNLKKVDCKNINIP